MEIKDFEKLKSKFQKKQNERAEDQGKLKVFKNNLKELGFDSVKAGKAGLEKLKQDEENLTKKAEKAYKAFIKKYGKYL